MKDDSGYSRRRWGIIIAIIGILIITVGLFLFLPEKNESASVWESRVLTSENLPQNLENFKPIGELPEDGVVELSVGDTTYTIRKNEIQVGAPSNPDISIYISDAYLDIMGQYGWCAALSAANQKKDLRIEFHQSEAGLAWKYRALVKYRRCLG